jgi:hypothetical protein
MIEQIDPVYGPTDTGGEPALGSSKLFKGILCLFEKIVGSAVSK